MLLGGNDYYELELTDETFQVLSGFGGGLSTEELCGALSGGVAVLGVLFNKDQDYDKENIKEATKDFVESFQEQLTSTNCKTIKDLFRDEMRKCIPVVDTAARVLEEVIEKYQTSNKQY